MRTSLLPSILATSCDLLLRYFADLVTRFPNEGKQFLDETDHCDLSVEDGAGSGSDCEARRRDGSEIND